MIGEIIFHASVEHRFSYSRNFLVLKEILDELPNCELSEGLRSRFVELEKSFLSISDADMVFLNIDPLLKVFSTKAAKKNLKDHSVLVMRRVEMIHKTLEKLIKEVNNFEKAYIKLLQQEEQKRRIQENIRNQEAHK